MTPFWADADVQRMLDAGRGDAASMTELVEKHYGSVLRYCYRRVRDFAAAEELAQEVFLRVYRSRFRYQPSARFTTWLYRIASNVVVNWVRDTTRDRSHERLDAPRPQGPDLQVADQGLRIDEWMALEARAATVRRALQDLPERQRAVVWLHSFEEMPGPEIAEAMGCSHQAVRSLLFRAYATLRTRLTDLRPTVQ